MAKLGELNPDTINRLATWQARNDLKEGERKVRNRIDLHQVYELARCMLSVEDIAANLKVSRLTAQKWMEQWPEFAAVVSEGQSVTRRQLGKVQLDMALSGNPTMLIWLGKQYLNQSDKQESKVHTEINVTVQRATDELRNMPRGKLLEALEVMNAPAVAPDHDSSQADTDEGVAPPANEPGVP